MDGWVGCVVPFKAHHPKYPAVAMRQCILCIVHKMVERRLEVTSRRAPFDQAERTNEIAVYFMDDPLVDSP